MSKLFHGTSRQTRGLKVSIAGFLGNVILFIAKIIVGLLSGSIAVVIDSVNNLLDSTSSIITMFGFHFASKKSDHSHPHGHGRMEYVIAFFISLIIIATAIFFGVASFQRVLSPEPVECSATLIMIIALTILGKGLIATFYLHENRTIKSEMLAASGHDALADMLITSVTLVALGLSPVTDFPVDGVVGFGIAFFVLVLGGRSFLSNLHLLIGHRPDKTILQQIRQVVLAQDSFATVKDVTFHDYGPESREALIKVELKPSTPKTQIERDITTVQKTLEKDYSASAIIYWPPK